MKDSQRDSNNDLSLEQTAADWALKVDLGLSAEEQDAYTQWLAEDPRHREAMALYQWGWDEFDRLAGLQNTNHARIDPDLLAPEKNSTPKLKRKTKIIACLAAIPLAVALTAIIYLTLPKNEQHDLSNKPAFEFMARIEQRTLEDGSVIKINRGGKVKLEYSSSERRIILTQGEANFEVAKDPSRPFIVSVSGIDVRAVGTIFNVKRSFQEVNVVVTEGKVNVRAVPSRSVTDISTLESSLEVGQIARVKLDGVTPVIDVVAISQTEIDKITSWHPRLLDFDKTPLSDIIAEFNRCNQIQVTLGDPTLESVRMSSTIWSDNVEGFVRLMESSFGMRAEWRGTREIILRKES